MLPDHDTNTLAERAIAHTITVEGGMTCVVFTNWHLPGGYNRPAADLLIRLPAGYPDVAPDMWWFEPAVELADGRTIPATEVREEHLGRTWQRWSRHFDSGQWQSGIDGIENYLALINRELVQGVGEPVR